MEFCRLGLGSSSSEPTATDHQPGVEPMYWSCDHDRFLARQIEAFSQRSKRSSQFKSRWLAVISESLKHRFPEKSPTTRPTMADKVFGVRRRRRQPPTSHHSLGSAKCHLSRGILCIPCSCAALALRNPHGNNRKRHHHQRRREREFQL